MKKISIVQLAQKIFNRPWMLDRATMSTVINFIVARNENLMDAEGKIKALPQTIANRLSGQTQNGIAVISVCGILTHKSDGIMDWLFGDSSYEDIRAQFQAALADPNVSQIIFDVDSPGGEISGLFDLVDEIFNARGIKPIFGIGNETALSAAYAILSACEKIYLSRTATVGSVGVIMEHCDQSKFDERIGDKYTPIFAGARKNDFDPHSPLTPEALKAAQERVNTAYELFVKTVARNRGISPQAVRDTEAALYFGKNAVDIGFADSVVSKAKAVSEISKTKRKGGSNMNLKELLDALRALGKDIPAELITALSEMGFVPKAGGEGIFMSVANIEAIAAAIGLKKEQLTGDLKGVDFGAYKKEIEDAARAHAKGILEICTLGGKLNMAMDLISSNTSIDDARKKVIDAKAKDSQTQQVISTVTALGNGEVSPLVADARKRAETAQAKK